MPNEVFLRTRAGLTALVSTRAAGRILEGALRGSGHDPDDVDLPQMRSTLLGPVLQELEGVLPRAGLRRNLERLAKSLRSLDAAATAPELSDSDATATEYPRPAAGESPAREVRPVVARVAEPAVEQAVAQALEPTFAPALGPAVEQEGEQEDEPLREEVTAPPPATVGKVRQTPLTEEDLERHVQRFTQIEHVRFVSVIQQDGSLSLSRGQGPDAALLARLGRLALSLLAKGGTVRQVHLAHSAGQLFLYPLGPDLLVIIGAVELNLGTVSTAFTALALEEDQ